MLKNKLGITNQIELADVEEKITKKHLSYSKQKNFLILK